MNNANSKFVLFSLGSNIGNKISFIEKAVEALLYADVLSSVNQSSYYESEPYGQLNQDWFINIAISAYTTYQPDSLLFMIKCLEYLIGRRYRGRWLEREIDIDILLYDDLILESKNLTIPHPQIHKRKFVLLPLNEIAPNVIHPVFNCSIQQLLNDCKDNSIVRKLEY